MKSMNEFRRTVLEKAEQYEKEKKRRRKKIREVVLLCSFCIVVSLSAYLGLIINMDANAKYPSERTSFVSDPSLPSLPSTTSITETSGAVSTTNAASTSKPESETTVNPSGESFVHYCVDFSFHPEISLQAESVSRALILQSREEMNAHLSILQERYKLNQNDITALQKQYDDEFFETQSLICVEMIIDRMVVLDGLSADENLRLTLYYWKAEDLNEENRAVLSLEFISVPRDTYTGIEVVLKNS